MCKLASVWIEMKNKNYFTIQLIFATIQLIFATIHGPIALVDVIHGSHCTISINFYIYLQYF